MTLKYPPILPNTLWRGDGLSGFKEVLILPYSTPDLIYFAPTHSWREFFLSYSLETPVFLKVYTPCESLPEENSSSKTASPSPQPFFSHALKSFKAALAKIVGR